MTKQMVKAEPGLLFKLIKKLKLNQSSFKGIADNKTLKKINDGKEVKYDTISDVADFLNYPIEKLIKENKANKYDHTFDTIKTPYYTAITKVPLKTINNSFFSLITQVEDVNWCFEFYNVDNELQILLKEFSNSFKNYFYKMDELTFNSQLEKVEFYSDFNNFIKSLEKFDLTIKYSKYFHYQQEKSKKNDKFTLNVDGYLRLMITIMNKSATFKYIEIPMGDVVIYSEYFCEKTKSLKKYDFIKKDNVLVYDNGKWLDEDLSDDDVFFKNLISRKKKEDQNEL